MPLYEMSQNHCIVITIILAFNFRETDKSFIALTTAIFGTSCIYRMYMSVLAKSVKTGAVSIERHLECK